ncbi:hypothetical protein M9435_000951 [Picochlorum sp. BPE23]|nr:hypothetical protein M9435_000951 [Picochlorum sp. BPE23]
MSFRAAAVLEKGRVGFSRRPFSKTRRVWVAASQAGADVVKVSFRCGPKPVDFGQQLAVISNLSDWTANDKAVMLEWQAGDEWAGDCTMPVGDVEFKLAAVARQSDDTIDIVEWEQCDNKVASLSHEVDAWGIQCTWDSSEIDMEQLGKKKKRKRAKPKKKLEAEDSSPVAPSVSEEEHAAQASAIELHTQEDEPEQADIPAEVVQAPIPDAVPNSSTEGIVVYNFDDNDNSESASEMANRILGGQQQ